MQQRSLHWSILILGLIALIFTACGTEETKNPPLAPNLTVIRGCVTEAGKAGCFTVTDEKNKKTYTFRHQGARADAYMEVVGTDSGSGLGDCGGDNQIGVTTVTLLREKCS